ncbi:putative zinc knuckle [Monocercomonoides exilis]|uniref:putative zinc knuckle n=1 Tax=Monocercomonoides exilis TaxID=2049356 RepID=UPI00355A12B0|nr:putative zinc knuckle [Monocercomonoides exilis]|eukprot:MONOS_14914.1-p1 / transcript=MONOS_14914.1 / gene=MONOS_14914 / organism=Monocercomonoides_exilis_PA203 / gene_product=zinc knuckle / transcript_product=zinc knuckle / location=Mono_scaffold01104:9884-10778(+) / protein_length=224 / sequence_SO=supercontig / SO=protein_coding / is_pseudo=false
MPHKFMSKNRAREAQKRKMKGAQQKSQNQGKNEGKICFYCRKPGHSFAKCKQRIRDQAAQKSEIGKSICFNCGEAGHSIYDCPHPKKDGGASFATCFICKKTGHLSRDCPNNDHGIYIHGGACKFCGEKTHLLADCPHRTLQKVKEQSKTKVPVYAGVSPPNVTEKSDLSSSSKDSGMNVSGDAELNLFTEVEGDDGTTKLFDGIKIKRKGPKDTNSRNTKRRK